MGSHLPPFIVLKLSGVTTSTYGSNEASALARNQRTGTREGMTTITMGDGNWKVAQASSESCPSYYLFRQWVHGNVADDHKAFDGDVNDRGQDFPAVHVTNPSHTLAKTRTADKMWCSRNFTNSCESDPRNGWRQLHKKHVMVVSPKIVCLQQFTKTS